MSGHSAEERFVVTMEGRRRWSRAEKLAIVAEVGATSVSAVARKHNIAASLLFRWRRELGSEATASSKPTEPSFARVALSAPPANHGAVSVAAAGAGDGTIEIVLDGNRRVIVGKKVDVVALKQVIEVLEGR